MPFGFPIGIGWVIIARFKSAAAARVQAGVLIDVFLSGREASAL